jgi:alpha-amylase
VAAWFKPVAYSLILLRESGYPCVFFADLYGLPNDKIPAVAELPLLLEIRRRFAFGKQTDMFDDPDLVAWRRSGDDAHENSGCVVILSSRDGSDKPVEKTIKMGRKHAGEKWICVLGEGRGPVRVDENGRAKFVIGNTMLSVFLRTKAARSLNNIPILI